MDQPPGDLSNRCYDTRTKERLTKADISNINAVAIELLKSGTPVNPSENPFRYLWLVNCILYSVVVALYISKGLEKRKSGNGNMRTLGSSNHGSVRDWSA